MKKCSKCDLCNFANHSLIEGMGNKKSELVIVGDAPNMTEDKNGKYGLGNSQKMLEGLIQSLGMEDYYYTPAVKCRKDEKGKIPQNSLRICKEYLINELMEIKPKYVITLGALALKSLLNKSKIMEIHGDNIEHKMGFTVLPTYHPAMALRDPRFYTPIQDDFKKFGKIIRGEKLREHIIIPTEITKVEQFKGVIKHLSRFKEISYDLETSGLDPREDGAKVHQIILSTPKKNFIIQVEEFSKEHLTYFLIEVESILNKKWVSTQNGKFDQMWLWVHYGVNFPNHFDCQLSSHLLDENSPNSLKQNAQSFLEMTNYDVPLYIKNGKGSSGKGLTEEEKYKGLIYAASDGYATLRLARIFREMLLQDDEINRLYYELVMPLSQVYLTIEKNGVNIDRELFLSRKEELEKKLRRLKRNLKTISKKEINWNSPTQLSEVLFKELKLIPHKLTPGGDPSTDEESLIKMKGQHRIMKTLLEYRGKYKQYSGFILGWQKRMRNWKIYPKFKIAGTNTGRPSCADPNLQQVPRDPYIRSLVGGIKKSALNSGGYDWVFYEADYSQIELRVVAHLSRDPVMLSVFRNGGDIHNATYEMVMGCSPEDSVRHIIDPMDRKAQLKEERKKAKAINFGYIYGMGWRKFMEYAELKYGLNFTESESKQIRKRFFEKYPGLLPWHDRQRKIAKHLKHVRTLTGRKRNLPHVDSPERGLASEAERNAINSPVQGFGAEITLMAVIEINEFFENSVLKIQGTIHDANVGLVRKDLLFPCLSRVKKIMESPRIMRQFGIELSLPLVADLSYGNWGIAEEIKDVTILSNPISKERVIEEAKKTPIFI